jgi:hypothetical protein
MAGMRLTPASVIRLASLIVLAVAAGIAPGHAGRIEALPGLEFSAAKKKPAANAEKKAAPKPDPRSRAPFTAAEQDIAAIPGIPDARVWSDSERDFFKLLPVEKGPWLILSSGGGDGAFGAGLLNGWTASGKRPEFSVVTGVSTGALMAPYAFVGARYDGALRQAYTGINAGDIFEAGGKGESFLETWPLRELIARQVTAQLLADVAAEHARGRRLFILTANLDAGRFAVWNMGAIAAKGDDRALTLFRDVLLASTSIPGIFPPVLIEVEANGRRFGEMHADGGVGAQIFVAPESALSSASAQTIPASEFYIVANIQLIRDFQVTERDTLSILGRSIAVATNVATRVAIDRAYAVAKRSGIGFNLALIDASFVRPKPGPFDPDSMLALFKLGLERGESAAPFLRELPAEP